MNDILDLDFLPRIPFGDWIDDFKEWAKDTFGGFLDAVDEGVKGAFEILADGLNWVWPLVALVILAGIAYWLRGPMFALMVAVLLLLVQTMELWELTMDTLSLTLLSVTIALVVGIPLGVLASASRILSVLLRPILDFMQAIPAFVYLLATLILFGIGPTPGIVSTVIFAMPPAVRLTELGIRQVDPEVVEAAQSFGTTPWRTMRRIKLPLAVPTITAGVNQVIMLALSMVVIAGLAGAGGLGEDISEGIARLQLGKGSEAGIAVVIIAIILDRMTAALSQKSPVARAEKAATG